jgi:hypothetical protein
MPISAGCQAVTDSLIAESGRIAPELFQRSARQRPINGIVGGDRGIFPNSMGLTVNVTTIERSFSTSTTDPWTTVALSDGASVNSCLPPVTSVGFGFTTRAMTPKHMALETPYFCIRDILQAWQFAKSLSGMVDVMSDRTSWEWARKWTADYVDISGHNLTIRKTGNVDNGSNGYDTANPPTAHLDFGTMEEIYMAQFREGRSVRGTNEATGAPIAEVIMSDEQFRILLRDNPQLVTNTNFAFMGARDDNPLLPGGYAKRRPIYGNWVIWTDPYPRRFALSGGVYVEIPVWVSSSTTKGNKQEINPAYLAAPFEEVLFYNPDVFKSLAWNANPSTPAPGWVFDAVNSMGDWRVKNIEERGCNPDGDQVFWRAIFADAAEPINPSVGYSALVLRCPYPKVQNNCYGD